jgi:hypothetical protein
LYPLAEVDQYYEYDYEDVLQRVIARDQYFDHVYGGVGAFLDPIEVPLASLAPTVTWIVPFLDPTVALASLVPFLDPIVARASIAWASLAPFSGPMVALADIDPVDHRPDIFVLVEKREGCLEACLGAYLVEA